MGTNVYTSEVQCSPPLQMSKNLGANWLLMKPLMLVGMFKTMLVGMCNMSVHSVLMGRRMVFIYSAGLLSGIVRRRGHYLEYKWAPSTVFLSAYSRIRRCVS